MNNKTKVEILIFCHNFQRRLCWVLSSIHQQIDNPLDIIVNISSLGNNGNPTTESVIKEYDDKLKIKHTVFKHKRNLQYPSLIKNIQIAQSSAEWILCHSCDHIFHPHHFKSIAEYILGKYKGYDKCLSSLDNIHLELKASNDLIDKNKDKFYIENAYEKAFNCTHLEIPERYGPGGYIIFRRQAVIDKNSGKYCTENHDRNLFRRGMRTWSDLPFREAMGGTKSQKWPPMVGINHVRDKELGYHTEEQR